MYTENSHGNWAKPPMPATMDCTAVAMTVESMATRPVESIMASSSGPRSDRRPMPALSTFATCSPDLVRLGLQAATVPGYSRRRRDLAGWAAHLQWPIIPEGNVTHGWAGATHRARGRRRGGCQRLYECVAEHPRGDGSNVDGLGVDEPARRQLAEHEPGHDA